jgi:hypothetical protein
MAEISKPASAHRKRVYRSPALKMYGAIRELTAGGTGTNDENMPVKGKGPKKA